MRTFTWPVFEKSAISRRLSRMVRSLLAFCFATILFFGVVRASDQPVDVTVFFSYEDPHWTDAQKVIDAAAEKYPRLRVKKVSVDSAEGYKALRAAEEKANVKECGELTILIGGGIALTSKGDKRDAERLFNGAVERMLGTANIKGKRKVDVAEYSKDIFGKDASVAADDTNPELNTEYFRVSSGGKPVGWIANTFHEIECPVCNDVQFLVSVKSPDLTIIDMRPVQALERRGEKLSDEESKKFLGQFKDRSPDQAGRRVDAISGATKTTVAYQISVANVLEELKKREKK